MMKESKLNNSIIIADITNRLLPIFDILRVESVFSEDYHLVLFLLTLYKDDYLEECKGCAPFYIRDCIEKSIRKSNAKSYREIIEISGAFNNSLQRLHINALHKIIQALFRINIEELKRHFSDIFDIVLYRIAKSQGRQGGEFIQPTELSRLVCNLADLEPNSTVFNPFAGVASFGVFLDKGQSYFGQEINYTTWAIGALRILAYEKQGESKYDKDDSILHWPGDNQKFDLVVSNPPYGAKFSPFYRTVYPEITTTEQFLIEKGISSLTHKGKLIAILSNGFLFRGGSEQRLRAHLIESDLVESIIALPGGLLLNTGMPLVILVINKAKRMPGVVKFVDAKNFIESPTSKEKKLNDLKLNSAVKNSTDLDVVRIVSNEKIAENDFSFNVPRYFQKNFEGVLLGDLGAIISGRRISEELKGKFVRIRDLKDEKLDYQLSVEEILEIDVPRQAQLIEESCLLLALRWETLKPTFFRYEGIPIFITPDILAFKIDESKININFLINELNSNSVTEQIVSLRTGNVIPSLKRKDLLSVKLKLPEYHDQEKYAESLKEQELISDKIKMTNREAMYKQLGLQQELESVIQQQKNDLSIKKHNIMQHLNNVKESAELLFDVMNKNGGSLDKDFVLNLKRSSTVESRFKRMLESINESLFFVDNITNDISYATKEKLNINDLIFEATDIGMLKPELFEIEYNFFHDSFELEIFSEEEGNVKTFLPPIALVSKKDFFELYNNILENAINHGFTTTDRKYKFKIELFGIIDNVVDGFLTIFFSNDGLPFPKGMADRYCIKGEKAGRKGNLGIGTWKVCEIAKEFGGKAIAHDQKYEEFTVKIEVKIPWASFKNF